ncbi:unnamed protein product [Heterobilharzia americana]|nr:unnamed protein product [Heterobilharzia americana]
MAKSIRTGQQGFILASYVSRNYLGEENDGGRQTISENTRNLSSSLETNSNSQSQTPSGAIHQSDALRNSLQARYPRVIGNNDSDYDPVDSQINRLRTTNSNIQSNKPNLSLTKKRKSSTRPLPTLD